MATARKRTAEQRRDAKSAAAPRVDLTSARAFTAAHLRGAEVVEKFANASFSIAGKVFAFTRPDGLVLKLPTAQIDTVLAKRDAALLVMGKRTMREWVHLRLAGPEDYRGELSLLVAAMGFVQSHAD
jgi:hypothetical protein